HCALEPARHQLSIASRRLRGRISVQFSSTYARHSARPASPKTLCQPAGRSAKVGQKLCWSSSFTNTTNLPVSSSKGLVLIFYPGRRSSAGAQIGTEHPIGQQPQTTEVGKAWTLVESGEVGQEQLRGHIDDGQVVSDRILYSVTGQRATQAQLQQIERVLTEQGGEPQRVGARPVDHQVETMDGFHVFAAPVGGQRQPDLLVATYRVGNPSAQMTDAIVGQQGVLDVGREHSAVGTGNRVAPFVHGQRSPVGGVGEQRVLEEALAAGEQRHLRRYHGDGRNPV